MKLIFGGDFYCGEKGNLTIYESVKQLEFEKVLGNVKPLFSSADFSFVNVEAPITTSLINSEKTGPCLKNPIETVRALQYLGVTGVMLANNHIADYGAAGIADTLNEFDQVNLATVGAGDVTRKRKPLVIKSASFSVTLLNFAENEWIKLNDQTGANPVDFVDNFNDIKAAKRYSDFVIVNVHTGCEFNPVPTPGQQKLCRFYIDAGADMVLCHHTHVLSSFEWYDGKYIHYGLGNLLMNFKSWNSARMRTGAIIEVKVTRDKLAPVQHIVHLTENNQLELVEDLQSIEEDQGRINRILQSNSLLIKEFEDYVKKVEKQYEAYIEPYSTFFKRVYKKGYLPSMRTKENNKLLLNLIRCESHREVLIALLESK